MVHGIAAAVLFICLALFPLLLFSQSRERGHVYRRIGWTMLGLLLLVVAFAFAPDSIRVAIARWKPVLVLETLLIWAFGLSWFEKGRELAAAARAGQSPAEAPRQVA
jgi:4-amino-4-deoxy-L-arabinose transferase-like glycosyltransferase